MFLQPLLIGLVQFVNGRIFFSIVTNHRHTEKPIGGALFYKLVASVFLFHGSLLGFKIDSGIGTFAL